MRRQANCWRCVLITSRALIISSDGFVRFSISARIFEEGMPTVRTCTASTVPYQQAGYMSAWLDTAHSLLAHVGYPSSIAFTVYPCHHFTVCSPAFSLLIHDIMIPCLAAAGVLYTRLHPSSIPSTKQALVPSVLLYFDWSTLTSDRSDGDGKNLNLVSSLERDESLCALRYTVKIIR